jgi:hypothetical protein
MAQTRRPLAIAMVVEGTSRLDAARQTRMDPADPARLGAPFTTKPVLTAWHRVSRQARAPS